jgi:RNA polymerase sigma factor (sigma-70 family)
LAPVLRPDQPVTRAQDALLSGIARRARDGDPIARDLLWRALAPKLEPALVRCGQLAWQRQWVRRDGRPWVLEDLRQEAWLVFTELAEAWPGDGSFVQYATAYFPWRLRDALRRLAANRREIAAHFVLQPVAESPELLDIDAQTLLASIAAALPPGDAAVLRMRTDGAALGEIACSLGVSRRTIGRRWRRIRRVALAVLGDGHPKIRGSG